MTTMRGTLRLDQVAGVIEGGTPNINGVVRLGVELTFREDECGDARTVYLPEGMTLLQEGELFGPGHRITVTVERVASPCGECSQRRPIGRLQMLSG